MIKAGERLGSPYAEIRAAVQALCGREPVVNWTRFIATDFLPLSVYCKVEGLLSDGTGKPIGRMRVISANGKHVASVFIRTRHGVRSGHFYLDSFPH